MAIFSSADLYIFGKRNASHTFLTTAKGTDCNLKFMVGVLIF